MRDIETIEDCRILVQAFYATVRLDRLLGSIFEDRLRWRWVEHMETMVHFWGTVLFARPLYHGNPIARHAPLALEPHHFDRWLALWGEAVDQRFAGPRALQAKRAAARMAVRMSAPAALAG